MGDNSKETGSSAKEPQCYNCGVHGHLTFACHEPTRAVPAGLEAHRKRQALEGSSAYASKGNASASSQYYYTNGNGTTPYPPGPDSGGRQMNQHYAVQQSSQYLPPPPLLPPPPPPPPSGPASAPGTFPPPHPTSQYPPSHTQSSSQPQTGAQDPWAYPQPPNSRYAAVSYPPPVNSTFPSYDSYGRPMPPAPLPTAPYYGQAYQPPQPEYPAAPPPDGTQSHPPHYLPPQPPTSRWTQNGLTGTYPPPGVYPYPQGAGNTDNSSPWRQGRRGDGSFSSNQNHSSYNNRRGRGGSFSGGNSNRGGRGDRFSNNGLQRGYSEGNSSLATSTSSATVSTATGRSSPDKALPSQAEASKDGSDSSSSNGSYSSSANTKNASSKSSASLVASLPKPPGLPAKPPTPISMMSRHRQQPPLASGLGSRPPPWSEASTAAKSAGGHGSPVKAAGLFPYNGADGSHTESPKRGRDNGSFHASNSSDRDGKRLRPSPIPYSTQSSTSPHSEVMSQAASPARRALSPHGRPHAMGLPGGVPASLPVNPILANQMPCRVPGDTSPAAGHEHHRSDYAAPRHSVAKSGTWSGQHLSADPPASPVPTHFPASAPPMGRLHSRGRSSRSRSRSRSQSRSRSRSDRESQTGSHAPSDGRGRRRNRSRTVSRSSSRSYSHSPLSETSERPVPAKRAASPIRRRKAKHGRSRSSSPLDDLELAMLGMVRPEDGGNDDKGGSANVRGAKDGHDSSRSQRKSLSQTERIKKRPPRLAAAYSRRW